MLDVATLRVAFGVVALTMLALFYFVTYRSTRSAYAAWWCASLGLLVPGAALHLFDGTVNQVWANPLANVVVVTGAACVWAGTRSLWTTSPPWWQIGIGPAVVGLFSAVGDPATNIWAGAPFYLGAMWLLLGMAATELFRQERAYLPGATSDTVTYRFALRSMSVGCALVAVYYFARWAVFLAVGSTDPLFLTWFGGEATILISTVLLAAVSFSMSTLGNEQQTAALRETAVRDGLTGLLNRTEFTRLAIEQVEETLRNGVECQLILADLDHFKQINDELGHLAGDHAIATFANACTTAVRSSDLVGRYGGEEFLILLAGASADRATQVTDAIDDAMREAAMDEQIRLPTVSYGIATVERGADLEHTIGYADAALYRAKAAGRNRSVHYFPGVA
ncbi:MAG TPA: GGDEF domain-containing protein [Nocardioides sp.]|nr:GGDEF domain-containing protein [Nocardioides sp.]